MSSIKRGAPVSLAELDDSTIKTGRVEADPEPAADAASGARAGQSAIRQRQQLADSLHEHSSIPTSDVIFSTRDSFDLGQIKQADRKHLPTSLTGVIVVVNDFEWRVAKMFIECQWEYALPNMSNQACYIGRFRGVDERHLIMLVRLLNATGGGSSGADGSHTLVSAILQMFSPRFVVGIGCAGAWDDKIHKKADVLVSSVLAGYSFRKGAESRNQPQTVFQDFLNIFINVREQWKLEKIPATDETEPVPSKIHFGAIISGDKLVVEKEDMDDLKDLIASGEDKVLNVPIVGCEMEGVGIWAACMRLKVASAIIKGPSDFCKGKADQTPSQKEEAQVRASFAAFHFFRYAFQRALCNGTLPVQWMPAPSVTSAAGAVSAPVVITDKDPGFTEVSKLVQYVRDGNEAIKAKRKVPPTGAELSEYKTISGEIKELKARKDILYKKIAPKLGKAWDDQRAELTAEAMLQWDQLFKSNCVELAIDNRPYLVTREVGLGRVKWSAEAVQKFVDPLTFNRLIYELRKENKESLEVKDLTSKQILPEKATPKAGEKKGAVTATAAADGDADTGSGDESAED